MALNSGKGTESSQEAAKGTTTTMQEPTTTSKRVPQRSLAEILNRSQMTGSLSTKANEFAEELNKQVTKSTDGALKVIQKRFPRQEVTIIYNQSNEAMIINYEEESDKAGVRTPITVFNNEISDWMATSSQHEIGVRLRPVAAIVAYK